MPRSAPAVRLQGREDRRWRLVRRAFALLVVGGTATWCALLRQQGLSLASAHVAVPAAAALLAVLAWRVPHRPHGTWELRWDGAVWSFDEAPCHVHAALDLGGWLLLAITATAAPATRRAPRRCWVALSRRDHPAAWHGLRCALYCARPHPLHPPGHGAAPTPDER